jgi:nucleotide-binding universal stress UspA family protein
MFMKVIVGDDGRDGGADALGLARVIAPDAELILASAYPWDAMSSRFAQLGYGTILRDDAEKALRKRRDEAGLPKARIAAMADTSPARALHHLAEAEHADLLVTGTSRHSRIGRMLLGDVSRDVLHGSPCPVAVAPHGFTAGRPATIGVAYDHSPEADKALAVALDTASALGARIKVREVVAADMLVGLGGYPIVGIDEIVMDMVADAEDRLQARVQALRTDVAIDVEAVSGGTNDRLEELAEEVDLLVCGSRGWGSVMRVVLGSTAHHLIHHADCPVLVVPRTADTDKVDAPAQTSTVTA